MTPTDEQKRAWQRAQTWDMEGDEQEVLADFARDLLAALMESEFRREHDEDARFNSECIQHADDDPRHEYTAANWQAAAEAVLREKP